MLGKQPTDVISENQGEGKGTASNHLFLLSFFPLAKCFFLVKQGGRGLGQRGGGMLVTSPLVHSSQRRPRPTLQGLRAVRVSH